MVGGESRWLLGWVVVAVFACSGCAGDDAEICREGGCGGSPVADPCLPPNRLVAGDLCLPPGVQDNGCSAGEYDPGDGSCQPAGIPAELCGTGFVPTDDGCTPVLPGAPCPSGTMALPGESTCRPVAPCGPGPWGDIPVETSTVYVDASHTGGASDGSATNPFVTIGEGLDAASPGAIVAVAEGSYPESLEITKPVRLWGLCPDKVEVLGADPEARVIFVRPGGNGTEIRSLAISGARIGLLVTGALNVVAETLWVHDLSGAGIDIEDSLGPTSVTVSDSLVEQVHELGILVADADVTIERSVVRDTQPLGNEAGHGILVSHGGAGARPIVLVSQVLVERNHKVGFFVAGGDVTVVDSVVRDTLPRPLTQGDGWGVKIRESVNTYVPSRAVLRGLHVAGNHQVGMSIHGSEVTAEAVTIRETQPQAATAEHGAGIQVQADDSDFPSHVSLRASVIENNRLVGLLARNSHAVITGIIVRNTRPQQSDDTGGHGVDLGNTAWADTAPVISLEGSLIEGSHDVGLLVLRGAATVVGTAVRDTQPQPSDGTGGSGIAVQWDGWAHLAGSLVEGSADSGLQAFATEFTVESTLVSATQPASGLFGDGVISFGGASVVLSHSQIVTSTRVGLGSWGATAAIANSALECNGIDLNLDPYEDVPGTIEDLGDNTCGCEGETWLCKALSAGITAPKPPE